MRHPLPCLAIRSIYCAILSLLAGSARLSAEVPPDFSQRDERSPLNARCKVDSLAFPLICVIQEMQPKRVAAGEYANARYQEDGQGCAVLWRIVPWQEKHAEFLVKYKAVREKAGDGLAFDQERTKLLIWCEQEKLGDCIEFVLRDFFYHRRAQPDAALYQRMLPKWRPYGMQRVAPFAVELPVKGVWHILKDDTKHHQKNHWSMFAFDLVRKRDGKFYQGLNVNENHYAWEQPIIAVCDGEVIRAEDKFADHQVGKLAAANAGNFLWLNCGGGVIAEYGHLRQGSLAVKIGDRVDSGQVLAKIGNSGASGGPHLHFTLLDRDGFSIPARYQTAVLVGTQWKKMGVAELVEGSDFARGNDE